MATERHRLRSERRVGMIVGATLILLAAGLALFIPWTDLARSRPTDSAEIASFSQLSSREDLFGEAAFVVIGSVEEDLGRAEGTDRTVFRVQVAEWFLGSTPDEILITQLGYGHSEGAVAAEGLAPLELGMTYVLALTAPMADDGPFDSLVLLTSEYNASPVVGEDLHSAAVYDDIRAAVEGRSWVYTPGYWALANEHIRSWIDAHPGFVSPGTATPADREDTS